MFIKVTITLNSQLSILDFITISLPISRLLLCAVSSVVILVFQYLLQARRGFR